MITDALRARALELGVELEYEDVDQQVHGADPAVVRTKSAIVLSRGVLRT